MRAEEEIRLRAADFAQGFAELFRALHHLKARLPRIECPIRNRIEFQRREPLRQIFLRALRGDIGFVIDIC